MTLSLGIGATSAIFSVVRAVLLTTLPYDAPEQRVMVVAATLLLIALAASLLPSRRATRVSPLVALRAQ